MEFVTKKNILYKFQSSFRKFHSTDSCLSYLQDKVAKGFDSGLLTGMILIDLQKAFDTIDHKILIEKMKCMGFSNDVTKWFESYLSKRMFSVHVEKSFSDKALISCGVPQGSILGPLLFLLYVNDMVQAVNCDLLLYADDTGLIFQHKDINIIEQQLNGNFSNICDWFVDNKLSIHFGEDKTKSIIFAPLKLVSAIFINFLFFDQMIGKNFKNYGKCFLFCFLFFIFNFFFLLEVFKFL